MGESHRFFKIFCEGAGQYKGGPSTPEGRRICIQGQITSLPAEDLAGFNRIATAIRKELDPRAERETLLATAIGESEFRLARVLDIDSGHPEVDSALCAAETWAEQHKQFMNLQLYETRLSNLVRLQTDQLNALQAARKAACKQAEDGALLLLRHAQSKGETYEPGDDFEHVRIREFVFQPKPSSATKTVNAASKPLANGAANSRPPQNPMLDRTPSPQCA